MADRPLSLEHRIRPLIALATLATVALGACTPAVDHASREGWPDDTVLARALAEQSDRNAALPGLYPVLAGETVFAAAGGNCRGNYLDTNNETIYLAVDPSGDDQLYYAFDTLERLTDWSRDRQSRACYLEVNGAWFASLLVTQGENVALLMNDFSAGPVRLNRDDLAAVAALAD